MQMLRWLAVLLTILMVGCSTGSNDFEDEHTAQVRIQNSEATFIDLQSGASVNFPTGTFSADEDLTVMFSDQLNNVDGDARYYPTGTDDPEDLVAGLVINTPADRLFSQNITIRFAVREGVTVTPGDQYAVYRFDFQNEDDTTPHWNRWGNAVATVDAGSGATVSATLNTVDFRGFVGSVGIFKGHTVDQLPAVVETWIHGTVVDNSGNAVPNCDVGLYIVVGSDYYPTRVTNGRVPVNTPNPVDEQLMITTPNTVTSAADGTFSMHLPNTLIGQFVGFRFARESTTLEEQTIFDVLAPGDALTESDTMVARYGVNNVRSWPVVPAN